MTCEVCPITQARDRTNHLRARDYVLARRQHEVVGREGPRLVDARRVDLFNVLLELLGGEQLANMHGLRVTACSQVVSTGREQHREAAGPPFIRSIGAMHLKLIGAPEQHAISELTLGRFVLDSVSRAVGRGTDSVDAAVDVHHVLLDALERRDGRHEARWRGRLYGGRRALDGIVGEAFFEHIKNVPLQSDHVLEKLETLESPVFIGYFCAGKHAHISVTA